MEKAIYYNRNRIESCAVFEYSDKASFYKTLSQISQNLTVIDILGNSNEKIYTLLKSLNYDKLLLSQVGFLYITNRHGSTISFMNSKIYNENTQNNLNNENNQNIQNINNINNENMILINAFLNVDAILYEMKNSNDLVFGFRSGFSFGFGLTFGAGLAFLLLDTFQSKH